MRFPEVYRVYRELYAERISAAELRQRQRQRLHGLLSEILRTVPVFRATGLRCGPGDDPFGVLAELPTTCKTELVAESADHCSDELDPAECVAVTTSGTTGVPLRVVHSTTHVVHTNARELARSTMLGLPIDRRILRPFVHDSPWFEYTFASSGLNRIAEFGFGERADDVLRQRCVSFAPDVVFGHPNRCVALVELLGAGGLERFPVPVVRTFGETLTAPVRATLGEFFGGQVRDHYGMNEVNTIAAECLAGRLHVDSDRLWVEVLGEDGEPLPDGEAGELTVTNFFNAAMPFVRYRTGDTGVLDGGGCECGDPSTTMRLVSGRSFGAIRFADGAVLDSDRVIRLVDRYPIRRLQVIQPDLHSVRVLVSPLPGQASIESWREKAENAIRAELADRLTVRIEPVDESAYHGRPDEKGRNFVSLLADESETRGGVR